MLIYSVQPLIACESTQSILWPSNSETPELYSVHTPPENSQD